jgi:hypothetical protein
MEGTKSSWERDNNINKNDNYTNNYFKHTKNGQ